jgi:DMSO reductase family type II enzyme chaperone
MTDSQTIAQRRSQLFQMLALAFAHPVAELHEALVSGSYSLALSQAAHEGLGIALSVAKPESGFADFEAAYIDLFQVGRSGKPRVHLNTADYDELAADHSRPEFLLLYTAWYKHFGLTTREDAMANELPDHIVCQLEFLTWLTHLEATVRDNPDLQRGYRCAQRDFCQRHLQAFLELLLVALQQQEGETFYRQLSTLTLEAVDTLLAELVAEPGDINSQDPGDDIAVVNLWG